MKLNLIICSLLFIFTCPSYCGAKNASFYAEAGPMLFSPVTEDIDLNGKVTLEFKWWRVELPWTDRFIFKLYKGYNTTASNLILKQEYSWTEYPIKIPASQFEENQVYTWVLVQVFNGGRKSDKSFSSFKIIKK
jgi:hypothetical protein